MSLTVAKKLVALAKSLVTANDCRKDANVGVLKGMTLTKVDVGEDTIKFETVEGRSFLMHHEKDCCEYVRVEDVVGDIKDLIGFPIRMAEEVSNHTKVNDEGNNDSSRTWTFYKFATQKGYVTIRWLGESNGHYSERVDFCETTK